MPELRKDPVTGSWVIISAERRKRPQYYQIVVDKDISLPENCPFCPGNESLTPPEILAFRPPSAPVNGPGWDLRVIPNKFPALRIEGELNRSGEGLYDRMNGIGAHEVIIETPDHRLTLADFGTDKIASVFRAIHLRLLDLKNDIRFRYIMVFKNFGATAGATLSHSHTQLIALPVIPIRVQMEIEGARSHFNLKERCIFCDILRQESDSGQRLLLANEHFQVLAPYAPRFPFELALFPREHQSAFEKASEPMLRSLSEILRETLIRIRRALNNPDYNLILHSAPLRNEVEAYYHWHIEFMPVLSRVAGFEWGSGFYINPVPPEESIQALKSI